MSFVVSLSNHERPFDKLTMNDISLFGIMTWVVLFLGLLRDTILYKSKYQKPPGNEMTLNFRFAHTADSDLSESLHLFRI